MHIKFGADDAFQRDIRARVNRYFRRTGRSTRDCPEMYVKTASIFAWAIASYVVLVFVASSWWIAVPAGLSLALAISAIGFNVQHDGGHRAYSRHRWVNRWMARSMDALGASSYIWDHKHNTLHHTYANISGHDDDIEVGLLGRLSPEQRRLWFHRLQHVYLWGLYTLLPIKWHFFDDFWNLLRGRVGEHRFARPRGRDLVVFIGGKVFFFAISIGVPCLFHPIWVVLVAYLAISGAFGLILSVVFQLAHVVEDAEFPVPDEATQRIESQWAVHQVETTVDFAQASRLLTCYLGGLNFQVEHHLFPRICHVHYPLIARIVERSCRRHGIRYNVHPNLGSGIASHFRWLRRMGRPMSLPAA